MVDKEVRERLIGWIDELMDRFPSATELRLSPCVVTPTTCRYGDTDYQTEQLNMEHWSFVARIRGQA